MGNPGFLKNGIYIAIIYTLMSFGLLQAVLDLRIMATSRHSAKMFWLLVSRAVTGITGHV